MSNGWLQERKKDLYHRRSKEEGYRSRSAYKLKQLNDRFNFLNEAELILDLGAAPGGWLQVASEHVGLEGLILGVDLDEIEPLGLMNVETIVGDITDPDTQNTILEFFDERVDVILSDMAPDVTGHWDLDQYRQIYLARTALAIADKILKEDGWLIVKIFQGREHNRFIREVRSMFQYVKNVKPKASRKESSERFLVAHRLKPGRVPYRVAELKEREDEDRKPEQLPGDQLFEQLG